MYPCFLGLQIMLDHSSCNFSTEQRACPSVMAYLLLSMFFSCFCFKMSKGNLGIPDNYKFLAEKKTLIELPSICLLLETSRVLIRLMAQSYPWETLAQNVSHQHNENSTSGRHLLPTDKNLMPVQWA